MKIVQCDSCGDLIIPRGETIVSWCACGLCCTWWRIMQHGLLAVWHAKGNRFCSVIGINNRFLKVEMPESGVLTAEEVFPETKENRAIVRVTPGVVNIYGAVGSDCTFEEATHIPGWRSAKEQSLKRAGLWERI